MAEKAENPVWQGRLCPGVWEREERDDSPPHQPLLLTVSRTPHIQKWFTSKADMSPVLACPIARISVGGWEESNPKM